MRTAQTFAPDVNSIPAARRFVLAAIGSVAAEQRDAVLVMVSELAMNAVEHARTRFEVTVEITSGLLRVEVTDCGGGTAVARPLPDATNLRGRGLFIVGKLSDAWGTSSSAGPATNVWFTVTLNTAADSPARQPAANEAPPPAVKPVSPPAARPTDGIATARAQHLPNDLLVSQELPRSARRYPRLWPNALG